MFSSSKTGSDIDGGAVLTVPTRTHVVVADTLDICSTCRVDVGLSANAGGAGAPAEGAGSAGQGPGAGSGGSSNLASHGGGGGGAGHQTRGTDGARGDALGGQGGTGGPAYGNTYTTSLADLEGSGGGGGGAHNAQVGAKSPGGDGGDGGGAAHITAGHIDLDGTIAARGANGLAGVNRTFDGGNGGGGSGGGIWLTTHTLTHNGTLDVNGGFGPTVGNGGDGGAGAPGHIQVDATRVDGTNASSIPNSETCTASTCRTFTGRVSLASFDAAHRVVDTVTGATHVTDPATLLADEPGGRNVRVRRLYDPDGNVVGVLPPRAFTTSTTGDPAFLIRSDYDACERAAEVAIGDHRNSRRVIRARLAVGS